MQIDAIQHATFWQRLLHRWFVQYNPLYLVSAAFVLVGVNLISGALARESIYSGVSVAAIAEIYAWALIGGAAFLTRINLRRPAVMLALLTAVYQCDPTLHTETCAYLGGIGVFAALVWLASFVGKLYALASAVRLRLSRSAVAVPLFGALGLVFLPRLLYRYDPGTLTSLVGLWVFALFAAALWSRRRIESEVALDAWGGTVFRRAVRATWSIWAVLALGHVWFWADEFDLNLLILLPVAALLCTRFMRSEVAVWTTVSGILVVAGVDMPSSFSVTALMGAIVLALRALRGPAAVLPPFEAVEPTAPYRTTGSDATPPFTGPPIVSFGRASPTTMARLFAGSLYALYLSVWTFGWSGGSLPAHLIALDLLLTAALLAFIWKTRARTIATVPLALTYAHLGVQMGLISAPDTKLEWGLSYVGVGFGLLLASLIVSWQLRRIASADPITTRDPP